MIKAIIFDVGGVLIRTEDWTPRHSLEDRLELARGQADELFYNGEMGTKAQMGEITEAELWGWIQRHLQLSDADLALFQREFVAGDQLDTNIITYIHKLHTRYQTAIISNARDTLLRDVTELYPMADAFDLIVGSAYERIMKPDAQIFLRTLERLGCQPEEAVFIDDAPRNIDGARAVGLHAIHFTPQTDLPAELAALGVSVAP
ncbi:MAG: HAD family phosphatase [Chloroflexota bacterium]